MISQRAGCTTRCRSWSSLISTIPPQDGNPGELTPQQLAGACLIIKSPINAINCPTRRESRPYGTAWRNFHAVNACDYQQGDEVGRLDYAANAGDQAANEQRQSTI